MAISKVLLNISLEQSARDFGCSPEDFVSERNLCLPLSPRLQDDMLMIMRTYGSNVVAATGSRYEEQLQDLIQENQPAWFFFQAGSTARILSWFGKDAVKYSELTSVFLPSPNISMCSGGRHIDRIVLIEGKELAPLYCPEWSNAMSLDHPERDALASVIYDNDRPIAVAACSRDTPCMWQIGVDVLPAYRRRGYACAVVRKLAEALAAKGVVPFYTAASANIASIRTALASGFEPACCDFIVRRRNR